MWLQSLGNCCAPQYGIGLTWLDTPPRTQAKGCRGHSVAQASGSGQGTVQATGPRGVQRVATRSEFPLRHSGSSDGFAVEGPAPVLIPSATSPLTLPPDYTSAADARDERKINVRTALLGQSVARGPTRRRSRLLCLTVPAQTMSCDGELPRTRIAAGTVM